MQSPSDVKALAPSEISVLAEEIREAIVEAVSRVGGHLGSNLGVVELTIALHRVFDSPKDLLVWDTGHQAYVHKMLTGRRDRFDQLRQAGGLSGYPDREESPHDLIENSHASTALSWVAGLTFGQIAGPSDQPVSGPGGAPAPGQAISSGHHRSGRWPRGRRARRRAEEERRRFVAIVGDGALTGGMAYEALNNIGHHQLPAIIVLNDNGRSYAETVSRLSERVATLRTDPRYRSMRGRVDRALTRLPFMERLTDAGVEAVKSAISEAPALQSFVEALGVRYLGPYDGHDVEKLEDALSHAARAQSPVLVHVLTQKGKGYAPAETDPEKKLHDTSAFDVSTGRANGGGGRKWTAAFGAALLDEAERRPELVALTAAMPGSTGLLPLASRAPAQVLDVGIAEQHAVTSAAGLAHAGKLPVFAVYSTFFSRAFDQANLDVGLHREHVVFVLDRAGVTGDDGPSHHGILDMALGLRIAGMTVLAPSCEEDMAALLSCALDLDGPVMLRFPKGASIAAADIGVTPGDVDGLTARQLRDGADVCVLAVGDRVGAAMDAAEQLQEAGIDAAVWDVRSVRPADGRMLAEAADAPLVVTVENGVVGGGAGTELTDRIVELAGVRHAPPVLRLGVPSAFLPHGKPDRILAELGLDGAGIAATTRKVLADER